jgi:hypothetical protein
MAEHENDPPARDGRHPTHRAHRKAVINRIVDELGCAESWEQLARCSAARSARRR